MFSDSLAQSTRHISSSLLLLLLPLLLHLLSTTNRFKMNHGIDVWWQWVNVCAQYTRALCYSKTGTTKKKQNNNSTQDRRCGDNDFDRENEIELDDNSCQIKVKLLKLLIVRCFHSMLLAMLLCQKKNTMSETERKQRQNQNK